MADEKQGFAAALANMDVGAPPGSEADQPALLDGFENGAASSPLATANARRGRGPGRPKGAKNRRTEEWAAYILSQYRSPLIVLAELYSMPVDELAAELQCEKLDAVKIQKDAAAALAPYVHQRQPQAIEVSEKSVGVLVIGELSGDASGLAGLPLAGDEGEQNQGFIDGAAEKSDGGKSDG